MNTIHGPIAAAFIALALAAAGCGGPDKPAEAQGKVAEKKDEHAQRGEEHKDEGLIKLSDEELSRAGVKVASAAEEQLAATLTVTGTVGANPERLAHVLPRFPGRVMSVAAKLGDRVKRGQVLAVLDSIEAGEAQSAYAQAAADAAVAKSAFERAERLHADQIIPAKEYQRARAEYEKTRAQLRAAEDRLRALRVTPGGKEQLGAIPILSPLNGTVIERKAVLGELARPDEALFVVADLSQVWAEANIAESQLGHVRPGARARVRLTAYPERVFEGRVRHVAAVLDKETRTAKAIVELANSEGLLRPLMFANVVIETGRGEKVLAVPESAVTLVQGIPNVFVEEAGGFEARPVELAERSGGKVVIKSGVKPGELVVTEGTYALKARLLKSQISEGHAH